MTKSKCECEEWGRTGSLLLLAHHPSCGEYNPENEIRDLLFRLIEGIETWSNDEDGIHPDCWDAYRDACIVVGKKLV